MTKPNAFTQGIDAYHNGLFLKANPFNWGENAPAHTAWNDGWLSVRNIPTVMLRSLPKTTMVKAKFESSELTQPWRISGAAIPA